MPRMKYYDPTLGPIGNPESWKHADNGGGPAYKKYKSVADAISSSTLSIGETVATESYIEGAGIGGGTYKVRAKAAEDIDDGGKTIFTNAGYVMQLITEDGSVNIAQYGALTTDPDISDKLNKALAAFRTVRFPSGEWNICSKIEMPKGREIIGIYRATDIDLSNGGGFALSAYNKIKNLYIYGSSSGAIFYLSSSKECVLEHVYTSPGSRLIFFLSSGISWRISASDCCFWGAYIIDTADKNTATLIISEFYSCYFSASAAFDSNSVWLKVAFYGCNFGIQASGVFLMSRGRQLFSGCNIECDKKVTNFTLFKQGNSSVILCDSCDILTDCDGASALVETPESYSDACPCTFLNCNFITRNDASGNVSLIKPSNVVSYSKRIGNIRFDGCEMDNRYIYDSRLLKARCMVAINGVTTVSDISDVSGLTIDAGTAGKSVYNEADGKIYYLSSEQFVPVS